MEEDDATTYTRVELCKAVGISSRTLGKYITHGVVDRPVLRSTATRYTERMFVQARVTLQLTVMEHFPLASVRQILAGSSTEELMDMYPALFPQAEPVPEPPSLAGATWTHYPVLPGLQLLVQTDASPLVQRIAGEIIERYRTAAD